ncbi:hypothetical protein [Pseudomonas sp. RT6P73]
MTTIDPASMNALAVLVHQVDAAKQALSDANRALEAAANAAEPAWLVCFEALRRAGDDYESAHLDLAEAMLEVLGGSAAEDDEG